MALIHRAIAAGLLVAGLVVPAAAARAAACDRAGAADFNGDGNTDLAVGDPRATTSQVATGAIEVIYGDGRGGERKRESLAPAQAAAGDGFGHALKTGHVDRDGCLDLVVGAPWTDIAGKRDAGAVHVLFGSPDGLAKGGRTQRLTPELWRRTQAYQLFGWSVDVAPARGSDGATIAVGAPYEDRPGAPDNGAVHVAWFGDDGRPGRHKSFSQGAEEMPGQAEPGDLVGWAVELGSVSGDPGRYDLIVTEPLEDVTNEGRDAGSMSVVPDLSSTPPKDKMEHWHYSNMNLPAVPGGQIGYSLAYLEEGGTRYVAVGLPGQTVNAKKRAGAVFLFKSTGAGLAPQGLITSDGVPATTGGRLGSSVALGGKTVTGSGVYVAAGAPYRARGDGAVALIPLADRAKGKLLGPDTARGGNPSSGQHFGWSAAFTGRSGDGGLVIGMPDDRQVFAGSVVVHPIAPGQNTRSIVPGGKNGLAVDDMADFGSAVGGP